MTNLEMDFFEEFKSVDNICKDMFQTQQGVTEYIKHMEEKDSLGVRSVPNWNEKYKMLKHLRWLRNQIAHDSGAPELMKNDLLELQNFHNQLLNQKDPLSIIYKKVRQSKTNPPKTREYNSDFNDDYEEDAGLSPLLIVAILFLAVCVGFVIWKLI